MSGGGEEGRPAGSRGPSRW